MRSLINGREAIFSGDQEALKSDAKQASPIQQTPLLFFMSGEVNNWQRGWEDCDQSVGFLIFFILFVGSGSARTCSSVADVVVFPRALSVKLLATPACLFEGKRRLENSLSLVLALWRYFIEHVNAIFERTLEVSSLFTLF